MSNLLTQLIVNGIGIAAAPWCIIGVILLLSGPRGERKSIVFLLGAATSMVVIYAVCVAAFGHFSVAKPSTASTRAEWAKLVAGLALFALGAWRLRRPPAPATTPRWLSLVDRLNLPSAYGIGLLMPNPIFAAAGGLAIVKANVAPSAAAGYLLIFILISLSSMLIPVLRYVTAPRATATRLAVWKAWLAAHSGQILTALLVGYGVLISVQAVLALT
ncbi:MAG TPA: GAP family protein [Gaiellales bacterium]|nr:GAP family protein [Gaiellales bacterium]